MWVDVKGEGCAQTDLVQVKGWEHNNSTVPWSEDERQREAPETEWWEFTPQR